MFIELTDHLRCVEGHPEAFLVLVPDAMEGRRVRTGVLGCPVCQAEYAIREFIAELGAAAAVTGAPSAGAGAGPDAAGIEALLGLEGPGGYLALLGDAGHLADALGARLPGIHLVAVNPGAGITPSAGVTLLRAKRMPLKARSLRGVVVGAPLAGAGSWTADSIAAVLPGLRAAGEGPVPAPAGFELLGTAAGWWVGRAMG